MIAQTPGGGRELNRGAAVALTVSRGAQPVAVPDVVGQTEAAATSVLEAAGLKAGVRTVPSSEPQGTVVAQSPEAGQRRPKGATVQINVSGGRATATTTTGDTPGSPVPAKVQIPDVVGMTLADARASLAQVGAEDRSDAGAVHAAEEPRSWPSTRPPAPRRSTAAPSA